MRSFFLFENIEQMVLPEWVEKVISNVPVLYLHNNNLFLEIPEQTYKNNIETWDSIAVKIKSLVENQT